MARFGKFAQHSPAKAGALSKPRVWVGSLALVAAIVGAIVFFAVGRNESPAGYAGAGSDYVEFNPATSQACEELRRYAYQGFPTQYIDEGADMLSYTSAAFELEGQYDAAQRLNDIIPVMLSGPMGQLTAKGDLISLADAVC